MIPMTLAQIASATSGTLSDVPDPQALVTAPAASDSRDAVPGGMFAAVARTRLLAWRAGGNGPRCSAAASKPAERRAAATTSAPCC